ncbi:MAG TPA: DUF5937 family protein [Euzebyales bacterium]|nr:DUF5937 family protein [Euzebyales bacterium]
MLRVRFSREDLTQVRFVISPLAETVLSVPALQRNDAQAPFAGWRDLQRRRLHGAATRALLYLVPAGWQPRVALAPLVDERPRFDEELKAVLDFSSRPLRAFMETLESSFRITGVMPRIPDSAHDERRLLGELLRGHHDRCIAEHWPALRAQLEADIAHRRDLSADRGVANMLATLHPTVRWNPPFLLVDGAGPSRTQELGGRGLVLVPSAFTWPQPILLLDGNGQPVLLYPARGVLALWTRPAYDRVVLSKLLGTTRAAFLLAATRGDSTTHLAERLELSVATASQHLAALSDAGLVRSIRRGQAVLHDITPLGVQLLLASKGFSHT